MPLKGWKDKPLRIAAVQCNYGENSFAILEDHVKGRKFNAEQMLHLTAKGHTAAFEETKHGMLLDKYLKKAHEADIAEIIYWNVHSTEEATRIANPEWLQRDKQGDFRRIYGSHYLVCINSPWAEQFEKELGSLCDHDIEGVFLDGPVFHSEGCFCDACKKSFNDMFGNDIKDATYSQILDFKVSSVTEFIRRANDTIKGRNPEIAVYINNSALHGNVTGSNTRKVLPHVDLIGAEGGFSWTERKTGAGHVTPMAKLLETQAGGKPYIIFTAGDCKPFSYYMHTASETKAMLAATVACGAGIWYGIHAPTYVMETPAGKETAAFMELLSGVEEYYVRTVPKAGTAILWSADSADYYNSSQRSTDFTDTGAKKGSDTQLRAGDHYKSFMGFYEMLIRSHVQTDVIDEESILEDVLAKYKLLVLPGCGCMKQEIAGKIREFAENGGHVISAFDTGFYDEKGNRYERPALSDMTGIAQTNGIVAYTLPGTGYMTKGEESVLSDCFGADKMPAPAHAVRTVPEVDTLTAAWLHEPMDSRYRAFPEEKFPGIIINYFGKGVSVYIASTFGELYYDKGYPEMRKIVNAAAGAFSPEFVSIDAPGSVEAVLRYQEKDDRYILHLINTTGDGVRPNEITMPVYGIKITVGAEIAKGRIKLLYSGKLIDMNVTGEKTVLTLDMTESYEAVVFSINK